LALALRNSFSASSLRKVAMAMDCRDDQKIERPQVFPPQILARSPTISGESIFNSEKRSSQFLFPCLSLYEDTSVVILHLLAVYAYSYLYK